MVDSAINEAVGNLMSIQPFLFKNIVKPIRAKMPLPPGAIHVLALLKHGDPISMSEIGKKLGVPKPHVTGLIDKLIAAKYVERLNDKNDRRVVNIRITAFGAECLNNIKNDISESLKFKL